MDEIRVIKVIFCSKKRRGTGTENDPIRCVREIFDLKGSLLAESDSEIVFTKGELISFALYLAKSDWLRTPSLELFESWMRLRLTKND